MPTHHVARSVLQSLLDFQFGRKAHTPPVSYYVGLLTALPTDEITGAGFTEVTGSGYARALITNDQTTFADSVNSEKVNGTRIIFPATAGSWGTVIAVALFAASSGGTAITWVDGDPVIVTDGKTVSVEPGDLSIVAN